MIGSRVFWQETCKVGKFWKIFWAKNAPMGVKLNYLSRVHISVHI